MLDIFNKEKIFLFIPRSEVDFAFALLSRATNSAQEF